VEVGPEMNEAVVDERARIVYGALLVLIHIDEPQAAVEALRREITEAFTQGFYAGIEAWDLAAKANGDTAGPPSAE